MPWFERENKGIKTHPQERKKPPEKKLWHQCNTCKKTYAYHQLVDNYYVCLHCNEHQRIGSEQYFTLLFENQQYEKLFENIVAKDILNFNDLQPYTEKLKQARQKTQLQDAMQVATGNIAENQPLVIAAMDFEFIGGSMGAVVGQKISLAADYCIQHQLPLLIIAQSGGARMMESAFSLMQMAKTTAKLIQLAQHQLPYISLLTNPTTGGVTASFAMLGDLNIAEPNALIGFAGPRIIKDTIKKDLPKGFQTSEFLLEAGFLDLIIHRKDLKQKLSELFAYFK